ncbi:MAG: nitroreductase [Gammaproteobacteria bacterium]|nr:nitroreductase [Gammaproteobacteria bacterium]
MLVSEALQKRKSVRAFLPKPVEKHTIERILQAAGHAPSGVNSQPWQVAVVTGETRQKLQEKTEAAFRSGADKSMGYHYYPLTWIEPYKGRRKATGLQMYSTLGIGREDKQRQIDQWAANYRAFDAPVMLLFFLDPVMEKGSFIDYGIFLQSIMLAAVEEGLATCPQAALGEFPEIVLQTLGYPEDWLVIGGMALGYEDTDALVNSYRTPREEIASFTRFFE